MKTILFRLLVFTHRYIGIAVGWLLLLWCLSGFVMMYVPYPELHEPEQLAALQSLDARQCCSAPEALFRAEEPIANVTVRMLAGQPAASVSTAFGPAALVNLADGMPIETITESMALASARRYLPSGSAAAPKLLGHLQLDQWTVYPRYGNDRPLNHVRLGDADGTEVYVSGVTGQVVQKTDRMLRFWNWLGAIPHWLYFTEVRQHPALWNNLVTYSSLVGCFLALFGIYLGILQLRRNASGQLQSPYRRWHYWHHVVGLVFGVVTLTWVFSGLMSMQPWGFLESKAPGDEVQRLRGDLPTWRIVHDALAAFSSATLPANVVQIETSVLQGKLYFLASSRDGSHARYSADWSPAPLSTAQLLQAAQSMHPAAQLALLQQEDEYYYDRVAEAAPLPVARVTLPDNARYYLKPISGEIVKRVDVDARDFRWLHLGLHRLDFTAWMRWRSLRDVWMWALLLGATVVCLTGTWVGIKRLRPRRQARVCPAPRTTYL